MECQSPISLNSIGFISELEASPSGRPTSQETKFDRFYKRNERFPVRSRIANSLCFISESSAFRKDDWAARDSNFAWFYKRIQRNPIAAVEALGSLNSLCFISEMDELPPRGVDH